MKNVFRALGAVALLALISLQPAMAASTKDEVLALKEEVQKLREGQAAMQEDLAEIRKLLESGATPPGPAPTRTTTGNQFESKDISVEGAPYQGEAAARVTLIEYSDYQCPFCKRHYLNVLPMLRENYIDTGKLRFVMREFPIPSLHPRAVAASLAALCAGDQGKYWEMHNSLFDHQKELDDEQIKSYSDEIGLDVDTFVACMDQGKYNDQVKSDIEEGRSMGISGTPSFAIGLTDPDDSSRVTVTKILRGAKSYESFSKAIDELIDNGE